MHTSCLFYLTLETFVIFLLTFYLAYGQEERTDGQVPGVQKEHGG